MSKIAVVFWSDSGNTKEMAKFVVEGAEAAGAEVTVFRARDFEEKHLPEYEAIAFGCPAMGREELDISYFEPMFRRVEHSISDKKVALFGSYGWGTGEWMRNWEKRCEKRGITLACESVICCYAPDDEAAAKCRELGEKLAKA